MLIESTSKARKSRRPVASRKKMEKKKRGGSQKKKFVCLRNTLMSTDRQASKSRVVRLDIIRRISKNFVDPALV